VSIPIFITTSDPELKQFNDKRYLYFVKSINSLEKTNADLTDLHIFDDHSIHVPKLQFLLSKSWQYHIKYRHENLGPTLNTIYAIDYMCNEYSHSKYIVFLQDDVIFSKNWLEKGIKIFENIDSDIEKMEGPYFGNVICSTIQRIGILCLYNRIGASNEKYYLMPTGHPGGVAWIIKTEFWRRYVERYSINDQMDTMVPKNERTEKRVRNLVDYKICERSHMIGWDVGKTGQSLVQHIGDQSSLGKRDMTQHRSKNFIGEN